MASAQSLKTYLEIVGQAEELVAKTWAPTDPQLAADLHDQVFMNLAQGYFHYFGGDTTHPDFTPIYNNLLRLQPNPDDTYVRTQVDGSGVYRMTGERGTVRLLTVTFAGDTLGTTEVPQGQTAEYDFDDAVTLDADGNFDVIFSDERPKDCTGQWLRMPEGSKVLIVRRRSYDWAGERDPRLAIERLDVSAIRPRPSQQAVETKLQQLARFAERHTRQWLQYQDLMQANGLTNRIEHHSFSSLGGIEVQQYWWGIFDLQPGEALILETDVPNVAPYWNIQLNDQIWNTLEYVWCQSHLNGHQAALDTDGRFRAVICPEDPGVPNWLDTVGHLQGSIVGRWYKCDSHPVPQLSKVRLADLRQHLPSDTPHVTAVQRDAVIRGRARAYQMRTRW